MRLLYFALLALMCFVSAASAQQRIGEPLTVRSGEHRTFSRLVIALPQSARWQMEREGDQLTIGTPDATFTYDTANVFHLIPKTRIHAVEPRPDGTGLTLRLTGQVHAKAFRLASGAVVVDVIDGPETAPAPALRLPPRQDTAAFGRVGGGSPALPILTSPNARIVEAEESLLRSLGRAASQGLVNMELPGRRSPARNHPGQPSGAPLLFPENMDHLAVHAETAVERDHAPPDRSDPQQRARCLPDSAFDLRHWVSDHPPAEQIAEARRGLLREFDQPDPQAVTKLVRLYLALGFGAEARAVLATFPPSTEAAGPYLFLADILEGQPVRSEDRILRMADCSGKVALWAVLGAEGATPPEHINLSAVQSAFSDLPSGLRPVLGPALVEKLLAAGAVQAAEAIRNILRRTSSATDPALAITQAQIDMAAGRTDLVDSALGAVAQSNDPRSARAVGLVVDARIAGRKAVDKNTVADAAALVETLGHSPEGLIARRAYILGAGSVGRFEEAFEGLRTWPAEAQPELRDATRTALFKLVSTVPDDGLFLKQAFSRQQEMQPDLPAPLQIALAERLATLGFGTEADQMLRGNVRHSANGQRARAQAAIARRDGKGALENLAGLDGVQTNLLRAQAHRLLGEHGQAAELLADQGETTQAAQEAWRSGEGALISRFGTEHQRTLTQPSPAQVATDPPPEGGQLARTAALLRLSAQERQELDRLLTMQPGAGP